ncbi:MAG: hypothetical protein ACI82F_003417 [Planctomycetota bacterium]|jgi:hypothetical protein
MGDPEYFAIHRPIPSASIRMFTLLLSAALLAPLTASPAGVTTQDSPALERALSAISVKNASADLHFLASDELGGRDTPSVGQRVAALFIVARMQRLGLTPMGNRGFLADYQLMRGSLDPETCGASLTIAGEEHTLSMPQDYYLGRGGVGPMDIAGGAVFVGTGSAEELDGLDLEGKWAVCLTSTEVRTRDSSAGAKSAGAIGLLYMPGTERDAERFNQQAERNVSRLAERAGRGGGLQSFEQAWPVTLVSPARATAMLPDGAETKVGTELAFTWGEKRGLSESSEIVDLENVAAFWPGNDPVIGNEVIIISAHYDHVGTQGEDIYNGADDNGSGTTGMLQIAEALVAHGPLRRSVLLLWVSGEEKGLLGSKAWTLNPTLSEEYTAVCNLNIDMIGRNAPDYLMITPTKERPEYNFIVARFEELAPLEGFPTLANADQYYGRSDQINFSRNMDIPVAFLFSDVHDDYHQPSDTADKIDYDKLVRVTRLVVRMIMSLQTDELGA